MEQKRSKRRLHKVFHKFRLPEQYRTQRPCGTVATIAIHNHTRQSPYTTTLNKHGRELASKNWFRVARRESGAATKMRTKKIPPKRD